MENQAEVTKLLAAETDSAGYAEKRYAEYLDSVEAAQNRVKSSSEKLWQDFLSSDTIKNTYEFLDAVLQLIDKIGGLSTVLKIAIPLLILFNGQLIAQNITSFVMGVVQLGSSIGKLNALLIANPLTVYLALIVALVIAWKELNKVIEIHNQGMSNVGKAWDTSLEKVERSTKRSVDVLKAYESQIDSVNKAYEKAPWYIKPFIDKQEILDKGLLKVIDSIAETSKSYEEYRQRSEEAAKAAGYLVDENGRLYTEIDKGTVVSRRYADSMGIISETSYAVARATGMAGDAMREFNQKSMGIYIPTKAGLKDVTDQMKFFNALTENLNEVTQTAASGGVFDLVGTFKDLKKEIDAVNDVIAKSMKGEFTYDDIEALKNVYGDYLSVLELEGGKLEVNTDKLREYNITKAEQALATAKASGATDEEIAILENYIEQLKLGVSLSKEYIDNFQLMIGATSQSLGEGGAAFNSFGQELVNLSQHFEDGEMSATDYFNALESRLKTMDMKAMFGENTAAAQTFFAGLTMNAAQSLSQISSLFQSGEMSITEYTSQLAEIGDVFGLIGNMATSFGQMLGMNAEQVAAMGEVVGGAVGNITSAVDQLRQMQELNMLVQQAWNESTAASLQFGTEAYNQYMQQIANAAASSGQVFTDMSGQALNGASAIYNYLTGAAGNFQSFADQTASKTGQTIQTLVSAAGDMLIALGDAISGFKAEVNFTPTIGPGTSTSVKIGPVDVPISIPSLSYEITGSGEGLAGLGAAISAFGNTLKSVPIQFDASIYTDPNQVNQATGQVNGLSGAYNNLAGAANSAGSAMSGAGEAGESAADKFQDKLDAMIEKIKRAKEKEKRRLQAQLEAYKRIIDAKKKLLEQEKEEQDYLDSISEKRRNVSNIQAEIEELKLDDSEEGQARLLELEEELRTAQLELTQEERDRSYELQQQALDDEYEAYQLAIEEKIRAIDEYLADIDRITADAMKMLKKRNKDLFNSMQRDNESYANSISNNITNAWWDAYDAAVAYNSVTGGATPPSGGGNPSSGNTYAYHDGGFVGGIRSNEEFAKLLKGEHVTTQGQMDYLMSLIPTLKNTNKPNGLTSVPSSFKIDTLIKLDVDGNLDPSTVPDIQKITNKILKQINAILEEKGVLRTSKAFSI